MLRDFVGVFKHVWSLNSFKIWTLVWKENKINRKWNRKTKEKKKKRKSSLGRIPFSGGPFYRTPHAPRSPLLLSLSFYSPMPLPRGPLRSTILRHCRVGLLRCSSSLVVRNNPAAIFSVHVAPAASLSSTGWRLGAASDYKRQGRLALLIPLRHYCKPEPSPSRERKKSCRRASSRRERENGSAAMGPCPGCWSWRDLILGSFNLLLGVWPWPARAGWCSGLAGSRRRRSRLPPPAPHRGLGTRLLTSRWVTMWLSPCTPLCV
jgi:hypothetical protein